MSRDDLHFRLRIPERLKEQVQSAAAENHRSMTAEIVSRLEATFITEQDEANSGHRLGRWSVPDGASTAVLSSDELAATKAELARQKDVVAVLRDNFEILAKQLAHSVGKSNPDEVTRILAAFHITARRIPE